MKTKLLKKLRRIAANNLEVTCVIGKYTVRNKEEETVLHTTNRIEVMKYIQEYCHRVFYDYLFAEYQKRDINPYIW